MPTEDKQAFELLTRRHGPRLSRWISSLIWDRDEGENLSQEALTRAYAQLDQFRPGHQFSSWLNGIALNLCRHHLRSRARHASIVDPLIFRDVSRQEHQGVLSGIVSREQMDHALAAVQDLPIALREAFVLHVIEQFDYEQMERMCGVPQGTLRVRVHRAKALLRDALGSIVDTWLVEGCTTPFGSHLKSIRWVKQISSFG